MLHSFLSIFWPPRMSAAAALSPESKYLLALSSSEVLRKAQIPRKTRARTRATVPDAVRVSRIRWLALIRFLAREDVSGASLSVNQSRCAASLQFITQVVDIDFDR